MLWCALATVGGPPAIRTDGLPNHAHPRSFHDLRPASYKAGASACEGVVAMSVHFSSASGCNNGWHTRAAGGANGGAVPTALLGAEGRKPAHGVVQPMHRTTVQSQLK